MKKGIIAAIFFIEILVRLLLPELSAINWLITGISLILLLVLALVKTVRRQLNLKLALVFFLGNMIICLAGVLLPSPDALPPVNLEKSEELKYIYDSDQFDRKLLENYFISGFRNRTIERDIKRLDRTKRIAKDSNEFAPADYFYASFIFHHSHDSSDYKVAHSFALKAYLRDSSIVNSNWLVKATEDRLLLSRGKPQKHNTQHKTTSQDH